jgi:acetoacetyl-CoA synthetase
MGTSEFYAIVESLPAIRDSLVVHLEDQSGGPGRLLLFVVLERGTVDRALTGRISTARVLLGQSPDDVLRLGSLADPAALDAFLPLARGARNPER